jgi:hypothetical protein
VQVEAEVMRLENLKECRMRELVVKKHEELKEIRRRARLPEDDTTVMVFDAMDSGMIWCCWWSNASARTTDTEWMFVHYCRC